VLTGSTLGFQYESVFSVAKRTIAYISGRKMRGRKTHATVCILQVSLF